MTVFTLAPGGAVNAKLAAAGVPNCSEVKPTWKAGLAEPRAKICTRSGRARWASMAIRISPISDRLSLGASESW